LESDFHNATTLFFTPKSMTMVSGGAIWGKNSPDGGRGAPRPAVLGDALDIIIVPPDLHGLQNGSLSRSIFFFR